MKGLKTLTAAGVLLAALASANAADLSMKDTPASSFPIAVSGFYVNAAIGGGISDAKVNVINSDFGFAGFLGNVRGGYDMRLGDWTVGPFVGVSFEDVKGNALFTTGNQTFGYEAGVRVGRTLNGDSLLYGLVGYQGQHVGLNNTGFGTDLHGLLLGAGLEIDLKNHFVLFSEVKYVMFGDWTPVHGFTISANEVRPMAGIGYRF